MSQSEDSLKKLIYNKSRRLQILKEQQALRGLDTPPHVIIEIEDLEAELKALNEELAALESGVKYQRQPPLYVPTDWGEAPEVNAFWGRERELAQLEAWLL